MFKSEKVKISTDKYYPLLLSLKTFSEIQVSSYSYYLYIRTIVSVLFISLLISRSTHIGYRPTQMIGT